MIHLGPETAHDVVIDRLQAVRPRNPCVKPFDVVEEMAYEFKRERVGDRGYDRLLTQCRYFVSGALGLDMSDAQIVVMLQKVGKQF